MSVKLTPIGMDADRNPLMIATVDESFIGSLMLEILGRGDDYGWPDLLCGPGGWVTPGEGFQSFRVVRVITPDGKLMHDYETCGK